MTHCCETLDLKYVSSKIVIFFPKDELNIALI